MTDVNRFHFRDSPHADVVVRRTDGVCRAAIEGRRAARALADWARRFELGEPDFQVLWCLRFAGDDSLNQAALSSRLALSPAQISMTVERLGANGWIICETAPADRRRKLWRLTRQGTALLEQMLAQISDLGFRIADCSTSIREPQSAIGNPDAADGKEAA